MQDAKPRRIEYVEQTRRALLEAAGELFADQGYASTSIDEIAARARFTKGAVYKHWPDKKALFAAVLEEVERDAMSTLQHRAGESSATVGGALAAVADYIDICTQPRYRRIVIEQGPAVLGWDDWRTADKQLTGSLIYGVLCRLVDAGAIQTQSIDLLARLCRALIGEAAFAIAQSDDPEATKAEALNTLGRMLGGLRSSPA